MTALVKSVTPIRITIGSGATSATQSISVDSTKRIILFGGETSSNTTNTTYHVALCRIELTNSTTVTAYRAVASTDTCVVTGTVIEFVSGVNAIRAGTITLTSQASNTDTFTAVGANAFVIWLGVTSTTTTTSGWSENICRVEMTNSTTVTARNGPATHTIVVGYMVADLDSTLVSAIQQTSVTDATAAASYTKTITSCTPANVLLISGGQTFSAAGSVGSAIHMIQLTNATTVTATRGATSSSASRTINWTVVSFVATILAAAVQRNTIVEAAQASKTASITSVNTSFSACNFCGFSGAAAIANVTLMNVVLTNGTTVTAATSASSSQTTSFEVIPFSILNSKSLPVSRAEAVTASRKTSFRRTVPAISRAEALTASKKTSFRRTVPAISRAEALTASRKSTHRKVLPLGYTALNPSRTPRGLLASYPFFTGSTTEFLSGTTPTASSNSRIGISPVGWGLRFDAATSIGYLSYPIAWPNASTPFRVEFLIYYTIQSQGGQVGALATGAVNPSDSYVYLNNVTNAPNAYWNDFSSQTTAGVTPAAGSLVHIVLTGRSGTQTLYVNGVRTGTPGGNAFPFFVNPSFMVFGSVNTAFAAQTGAITLLRNVATVAWTPTEVAARYSNPFGMFQGQTSILSSLLKMSSLSFTIASTRIVSLITALGRRTVSQAISMIRAETISLGKAIGKAISSLSSQSLSVSKAMAQRMNFSLAQNVALTVRDLFEVMIRLGPTRTPIPFGIGTADTSGNFRSRIDLTTTQAVPIGTSILVGIAGRPDGVSFAVTDRAGNTYVRDVRYYTVSIGVTASIFRSSNPNGLPQGGTITIQPVQRSAVYSCSAAAVKITRFDLYQATNDTAQITTQAISAGSGSTLLLAGIASSNSYDTVIRADPNFTALRPDAVDPSWFWFYENDPVRIGGNYMTAIQLGRTRAHARLLLGYHRGPADSLGQGQVVSLRLGKTFRQVIAILSPSRIRIGIRKMLSWTIQLISTQIVRLSSALMKFKAVELISAQTITLAKQMHLRVNLVIETIQKITVATRVGRTVLAGAMFLALRVGKFYTWVSKSVVGAWWGNERVNSSTWTKETPNRADWTQENSQGSTWSQEKPKSDQDWDQS